VRTSILPGKLHNVPITSNSCLLSAAGAYNHHSCSNPTSPSLHAPSLEGAHPRSRSEAEGEDEGRAGLEQGQVRVKLGEETGRSRHKCLVAHRVLVDPPVDAF